MMTYKEEEILNWAGDKDLLCPSRAKAQTLKCVEEVGELASSINKGLSPIDDIGDIYVVLTILANQCNLTMQQCIDHAYGEIEHRTGETVDGVFIKDETPKTQDWINELVEDES